MQVFLTSNNPDDTFTWPNGAIGHRSGLPFDLIGPFGKVLNCPIAGTRLRRAVYATAVADTFFSIPAATRVRGQRIKGYLTTSEEGVEFRVLDNHKHLLAADMVPGVEPGEPGPIVQIHGTGVA